MFFPNPLPETIFRGSKCQPILDGAILEPFWIQGGSKNGPFGHHFRVKINPKMDQGAKSAPRPFKVAPKTPLGSPKSSPGAFVTSIWGAFGCFGGCFWGAFWCLYRFKMVLGSVLCPKRQFSRNTNSFSCFLLFLNVFFFAARGGVPRSVSNICLSTSFLQLLFLHLSVCNCALQLLFCNW